MSHLRPRGRPIEYNRDETLQRASEVFWVTGFAATSLDELSAATRLTRPSLTGAFGDKEALYVATLERYRDASAEALRSTLSGTRSLRKELSDVLAKSTDAYTAPPNAARGCLLIGTASVEAVKRPAVRTVLRESLAVFNSIIADRMRAAIGSGELDPDADPKGLALIVSAAMHSLAVRARAGETRRSLGKLSRAIVDLICGKARKS